VTDGNHVVQDNLQGDGDISREVEIHQKRQEFVKRHWIVQGHKRYTEEQDN
jgi:hypothetical protein